MALRFWNGEIVTDQSEVARVYRGYWRTHHYAWRL